MWRTLLWKRKNCRVCRVIWFWIKKSVLKLFNQPSYILTISHGYSRHLLRLLSQKTLCLQIPKSTVQLARHTCFHQANKKKFSTPPPQSRTQPSTAQRIQLPPQQRQVILTIQYLYPLSIPHPHLTPKYTHLRPTATIIPFYGSIFFVIYYGTILRGEFRPRQTW